MMRLDREPERTDIPPAWNKIELSGVKGTLMVIGAPDAGKTTFSQYLFRRLEKQNQTVSYLDGDPGQSIFGPPTTLTLIQDDEVGLSNVVTHNPRRSFVGSVSPKGHMLPMLVGAWRLVQAAERSGAQVIVYDTSGLVDPKAGGIALKLSKIELLRPSMVIAIQRERELEYLLRPLRRSQKTQLVELRPSVHIQPRDSSRRQEHRSRQFALYFRHARELFVNWSHLAVFPVPHFTLHRLVALEDKDGFTLALGIVESADPVTRSVTLLTPLDSLEAVDALYLGSITVDPVTFRDARLGK